MAVRALVTAERRLSILIVDDDEDANRALVLLKRGGFAGAGVLLTGEGSRV